MMLLKDDNLITHDKSRQSGVFQTPTLLNKEALCVINDSSDNFSCIIKIKSPKELIFPIMIIVTESLENHLSFIKIR